MIKGKDFIVCMCMLLFLLPEGNVSRDIISEIGVSAVRYFFVICIITMIMFVIVLPLIAYAIVYFLIYANKMAVLFPIIFLIPESANNAYIAASDVAAANISIFFIVKWIFIIGIFIGLFENIFYIVAGLVAIVCGADLSSKSTRRAYISKKKEEKKRGGPIGGSHLAEGLLFGDIDPIQRNMLRKWRDMFF